MKHKAFIEGCDIVDNNNNNENFGHYSFIFSHGVNVQLITSENDEFTKSIARVPLFGDDIELCKKSLGHCSLL